MEYSKYQQEIFEWIQNESGNAFVDAVAGSGKTTTIVEGTKYIGEGKRVLFLAFNKHIADTIKRKVSEGIEVRTLNALGNGLVRGRFPFAKLEVGNTRNILNRVCEGNQQVMKMFGSTVTRLISLAKALNLDVIPVREIIDTYGIDFQEKQLDKLIQYTEDVWRTYQFDLEMGTVNTYDFDDQLYIPVKLNLNAPYYDWIFVDEAQDLNPIQIELLSMMARPNTRFLFVGDVNQAIYGFRGADPEAVATLKERFITEHLPLSICYRCPEKVVQLAKDIVPHIEWREGADLGVVEYINKEDYRKQLRSGDYTLCRTTAPLVSECLKCIEEGNKAIVVGRNIGENLVQFIESLGSSNDSVETLIGNVNTYQVNKVRYYATIGLDEKITEVTDKCDVVRIIGGSIKYANPKAVDIINRIRSIFTEDATGIIFCTVHRSKGLEARNIFILRPDLLPHPNAKQEWQYRQEMNLKYVAITRSLEKLTFVKGE